jgi:hypothetical protein
MGEELTFPIYEFLLQKPCFVGQLVESFAEIGGVHLKYLATEPGKVHEEGRDLADQLMHHRNQSVHGLFSFEGL